MDDIIARIKGYVTTLNSAITDDAKLLLVVKSVVNRALAYTNRQQLVYAYEQAKLAGIDVADPTERINAPIPVEIEIPMAETVVSAYRTVEQRNTAVVGNVKSVTDNGQTVSFGDNVITYFATSADMDVFGGIVKLLDRYRLPTVNLPLDSSIDDYELRQPIGTRI